MHNIQVDQSHCVRCGQCVLSCPSRLFVQSTPHVSPILVSDANDRCIACNHCVSICPVGVIAIDEIDQTMCPVMPKESMPRFEHFATLARMRRSIRNYRDKPVERAKIQQIMDVVRWAPSAKNVQPVRWIVANHRSLVVELVELVIQWMKSKPECESIVNAWDNGIDIIARGAPCIVVAYSDNEQSWGQIDSTIAVTTLDLCATAMRLGSCWAGYFVRAAQSDPAIAQRLGLNKSQSVQAALLLGYASEESYSRVPWRKELDVHWLE